MENIRWKKVKLSPHTRDKMGLFARDYDRDLYLENNVWSPYAFETKAYPESAEKYAYFKFNQDQQYANNYESARDKAIEEIEAREEARRKAEKKIIEQAALQKAQQEANKLKNKEDAKVKEEPLSKMATTNKKVEPKKEVIQPEPQIIEVQPIIEPKPMPQQKPPKVTKLKIQNRKTLNALEELYFEALKYKIGK